MMRLQRTKGGEASCDSGKETTDADSEGESRQITKFAFKDRFVAKLGGEFGISLGQSFEVDGPSLPIGTLQLNSAYALVSMSWIFDVVELLRHFACVIPEEAVEGHMATA